MLSTRGKSKIHKGALTAAASASSRTKEVASRPAS